MTEGIHIFGIRHHGPGSARSLLRALDQVKPDVLLIEGPPDADGVIEFAGRDEMVAPVAILVHDVDDPKHAAYYPFAEFSPEWQAIRWALKAKVPVRFMDLPQSHRMAIDKQRLESLLKQVPTTDTLDAEDSEPPANVVSPDGEAGPKKPVEFATRVVEPDPLAQLARAAGFDDGERWWEHVVEHRRDGDLGMFAAVREAMHELRQDRQQPRDQDEDRREAWMRKTIRETKKTGAKSVAVVCGAWHAPVLDVDAITKKDDDALLAGLPKLKTSATWVPWTYDRLTFASGYGAGVQSPGWYEHLWKRDDSIIESWMTRTAHLLRENDIDCSSAHVIEAVRLSTSLAAFRGRPLADLSDIADATRSVFCFDSDLPMRLIGRQLLVGDRMGELPEDVPMVPLQQDLQRQQKRLRLKPEAQEKPLDLDLRNENDRSRSHLLHRLRLLEIHWGTPQDQRGGKGTFHELWTLRWEPEYAVRLIEAGVLGNTIEQSAATKLSQLAANSNDLAKLASYLQDAMLAELGEAAAALVKQVENAAAVAADVTLLMRTLPQLASLLRYGNVRQTDEALVREIVDGIVPRINAGLGAAVGSLNDEAAAEMDNHLRQTEAALQLMDVPGHTSDWRDALRRVLDQDTVHGLVRGRCARLLLDAATIQSDDVARRLSQTLSHGNDPAQGARWLEGFLSGSGLLLIHDDKLLGLIDGWVAEIDANVFQELVPLLRRTFTTFPAGERRQIGQLLVNGKAKSRGGGNNRVSASNDESIDVARAERALPLLLQMMGVEREGE